MRRRDFLTSLGGGALCAAAAPPPASARPPGQKGRQAGPPKDYDAWITARVARIISKDYIEAFLDKAPNNQWARFDPELGYVVKDSIIRFNDGHSFMRGSRGRSSPIA